MSLTLQNFAPALLGLAAMAIPIVIHLLLRQQPRQAIFPAMQLMSRRKTATIRRLRLRHLLLMALRMGLLLLLGLALARPTLKSSLFSIDEEAPVAAAFLFDTSPSMSYKDEEGVTRLEQAKALAQDLLRQMPSESRLHVVDAREPSLGAPLTLAAAGARVSALGQNTMGAPLDDALLAALDVFEDAEMPREMYVFTDSARGAWSPAAGERWNRRAEEVGGELAVYVIDVGVEEPTNLSLRRFEQSHQVLPTRSTLRIDFLIHNRGASGDRIVELVVDGQKRDQKSALAPGDQAIPMSFEIAGLGEGLHQGYVEIRAGDAMAFDDRRYFSVEVRPALPMLVVREDPFEASYWISAMEPESAETGGRGRFEIVEATPDSFASMADRELARFAAIHLIDVPAPSKETWIGLGKFVRSGGGLFVSLGESVSSSAYLVSEARQVLPAELTRIEEVTDARTLAPEAFDHPVLGRFEEWNVPAEMRTKPVEKYWRLEPDAERSVVVIPLSNGDPGLVERTFTASGAGRSLLLSFPVYRRSRDGWSELPLSWSFVALAANVAEYLTIPETRFTYEVGETPTIQLGRREGAVVLSVKDPMEETTPLTVDALETAVTLPPALQFGHYRLEGAESRLEMGFSVNPVDAESESERLEPEEWKEMLGEERVTTVRDLDSLRDFVERDRVGRDLFPWILLLVMLLIALEGYLSNRFYRSPALS